MFINFEVGQHSCSTDYLTIDEEKVCGVIESGKVRTYPFEHFSKYIYFNGNYGSGIGYHIRGRQVECPAQYANIGSRYHLERNYAPYYREPLMALEKDPTLPFCDQTFSETSFKISSPNYPNNYPVSIFCRFVVKRPSKSITGLDIVFKNFDLEDTPGCFKDYLEIDGSRICGLLTPNHQSKC